MQSIAVIIPAYNCASYIEEALASLEQQTFRPSEVVVTDDGSTDDTADRVRRFSEQSQLRITLVQQENQGIAAARNAAARHCTSEFLALLDGDDAFYPEFLETVGAALQKHEQFVLCFSDRDVVDSQRNHMRKDLDHPRFRAMATKPLGDDVYQITDDPFTTLVAGNVIPIGNLMLRRSTFEAIGGFDEEMRAVEDKPFLLELTTHGPFGFVDRPLGIWRRHVSNMSGGRGAYKMAWYRHLGIQKLAAEAAGMNLDAEQREAITQMQRLFQQQLLFAAADTGDASFPGLMHEAYRSGDAPLSTLVKQAMRFSFRKVVRPFSSKKP